MAYDGDVFRASGWRERPKSTVSEWVLFDLCAGLLHGRSGKRDMADWDCVIDRAAA